MNRTLALALSAALALGFAGSAHATTVLNSSALEVVSGTAGLCRITNLGTKVIDVRIDQIDFAGTVTDSEPRQVDPGATADEFSLDGVGTFRCRFTGNFSKSQVRALVGMLITQGEMTIAVPAE